MIRLPRRVRLLSRTIAAGAFFYAIALVATGGFEITLGPVLVRSHEIEPFIVLALVSALVDWVGGGRNLDFLNTLSRPPAEAAGGAASYPFAAVVALAVAVPGVWLVAHAVRAMTVETPSGDMALLELYTIHAARHDLFLGPYSRFGWHHPGPAMFYAFAPLYDLTGARYESLRWSALALNLASLGATLAIVGRRAGRVLGFTVAIGLGLYLLRVPDLVASPWNPHLLVLPTALLLVACAAIVDGEPRCWPLVAVVSSFLIQTHLSVAPTVGVVIAVTVWLVVRQRVPPLAHRHRLWASLGACLIVVMWILPAAAELTSGSENLRTIARFFLRRPMVTPSLREAFVAGLNRLSAPLLPGLTLAWGAHTVRTVGFPGLVIALGTLLAVPWTADSLSRRGCRFGAAVAILGLSASVAALWSISRSQGDLFDQLVFWITIVGVLNFSCLIAAAALSIAERLGPLRLRLPPAVTTAALWIAMVGACLDGTIHLYRAHALAFSDPAIPRIQGASAAVRDYLARENLHWPLVRMTKATWGDAAGVVLALERSGTRVSVEPDWVFMFGQQHAPTGKEDSEVMFSDQGPRRRAVGEGRGQGRDEVVAEWPEESVDVARLAPGRR